MNFEKLIYKVAAPICKQSMNKYIRPDDIFIVTYPKSGTSWLCFMIANLLNKKFQSFEQVDYKNFDSLLPDINKAFYIPFVMKNYDKMQSPRFFVSHATPDFKYLFNKIIYLIRDPRDVIVSYYYHHKKEFKNFNKNLEEFVYNYDNLKPAPWHIHVDGWLNNNSNNSIMVIKYEDMKLDTEGVLTKISKFSNLGLTIDNFKETVRISTFDNMKNLEKKGGIRLHYLGDNTINFVRKGLAGGYKKELTPALIDFINRKTAKTIQNNNLNYEL